MSQLSNLVLNEMKELYPSFLDTSSNSNLSKHLKIRSNRHSDILQQLKNLELMQTLERPLQIRKEQTEDYTYKLTFISKIKNMQSFTITDESGTVISTHTFNTTTDSYEETKTFTSSTIIPIEKYVLTVIDNNGYTYEKGYLENDTIKNDVYDHDITLDLIGKLYNIPRYSHISTTDYSNMIPPYHAKTTEDDYYYMKRIQTYIEKYGTEELPLLNFWKFYGFDAELTNRKDLICKQEVSYQDEHYMETDNKYNSCAYDFTVNYNEFPSNLSRPSSTDLKNLFQNSMPLQKKVFLDFNIKETLETFTLSDAFNYKIGETVVESNEEFDTLNLKCASVTFDNLTLTVTSGTTNNFIFIDDDGNLLYSQDTREDAEDHNGTLTTEDDDLELIQDD